MPRKKENSLFKQCGVCFLVILFLATGFSAFSQETVTDSTKLKKPIVEHSPRKATIYSAILPWLCQIYNRKYWKVPIVIGGFATFGYFINFNNNEYTIYKQAYSDIIDLDPNTNSFMKLKVNPSFLQPDNRTQFIDALRGEKDYWRRNRDLVVIGTVVFYALNVIDASVDAHFFNFNIGDDLTMRWAPGPVMNMNTKLIGINCNFTF